MADSSGGRPESLAIFRALAAEDMQRGASATVEQRLRDEVRRLQTVRRRALFKVSLIAAGLFIVTGLCLWRLAALEPAGRPSSMTAQRAAPAEELVTQFYPLAYSDVPMSGGRLVRMEVSPESVAAFGVLPPQDTETREPSPILAEVVVGDDGLARAVRFVRAATQNAKKEEGR